MCGIFGHVGKISSIEKCLKGLKSLEYRGYDSAGIAGIDGGHLICYKGKGKISELEKRLQQKLHSFQSSIGHTRWATHGQASERNAHPHLDTKKQVAIVHNGILENYRSLRAMLEEQGFIFDTETDSEVIAQLISYFYRNNLLEAVQQALGLMKGFWALAIIHKDYPSQIVVTRYEVPIAIGVSKKNEEAFISSDPYAFAEKELDVYFLQNYEIALVSMDKLEVFDKAAQLIQPVPHFLELPSLLAQKGNFEHFMLKEIFDQPLAIQNSIHKRYDSKQVFFEDFSLTEEECKKISNIVIIGCGTSWHAGCIAALQLEELTKIPTRAEIASEYRYRCNLVDDSTLVIALSQSGETFDTLAAMRQAKAKGGHVLAICNVPQSSLVREAHQSILLKAGPEISVCSTKAFSCQLAVLSLLTCKLAILKGIKIEDSFLQEITLLPSLIETILQQKDKIAALAKKYAHYKDFFFLGKQYMFPTSLEAALKLKEISYLNATAYAAGELKHGPIALINSDTVIIGLCGNALTYDKMLNSLQEVKARDGKILALAPLHAQDILEVADDVFYVPYLSDLLSPISYSVTLQLFSYFIAKELGAEIDQPRNLAKSVTVE